MSEDRRAPWGDQPPEALLDELERKMDAMTDRSWDGDALDTCLDALDVADPPEGAGGAQSWEEFRSRHAILFEKGPDKTAGAHQKGTARRRAVLPRLLTAAVIAILVTLLCVQGAGFDVFGVVGRWTQENFRFERDNGAGGTVSPAASPDPDASYATFQEALDDYGIEEALAPTWMPEGYEAQYIEAAPFVEFVIFSASYKNGSSELTFSYIYWTGDRYEASVVEKDDTPVIVYEKAGITHYIMSNGNVMVATWMHGTCECTMWGEVTAEELEQMIDSIYT